MAATLQKTLDLGFRSGKFPLPNDYFTGERGRSGRGQTLERFEWRTGHANQKNRRNAITSSHSCNRMEPAGGDKLKCSARFRCSGGLRPPNSGKFSTCETEGCNFQSCATVGGQRPPLQEESETAATGRRSCARSQLFRSGRRIVNVLPTCGVLSTLIEPL